MNEQSEIESLKRQLEEARIERDRWAEKSGELAATNALLKQERDQAHRACKEKDEALRIASASLCQPSQSQHEYSIKIGAIEVITKALSSTCGQGFVRASEVETVLQAFRQFVSTKRPLHNGPHGQVVYRLDFTGHAEGMVEDAFATLLNNAKGK